MQTERQEMSQNAALDVEATQCEEADQMLSERGQRSENRKNKAQLQKEKVTEAQAKLNEKLKRKAENDPVKRPKTKPRRTDCSPVWYFYDVIEKKGERHAVCKCGKHSIKMCDSSTSNQHRHLRTSHLTEFTAKVNSLEAESKKTSRVTNYFSKVGSWKQNSANDIQYE